MPPPKSGSLDPSRWFAHGANRLAIADLARSHEGLTPGGLEMLQAAVERYLKGFLLAKGWRLVRTHDLEPLVIEAKTFDSRFTKFLPMAKEVTEDFFAQHYPGDDADEVSENYDTLREQAGEMIELIKECLPKYFPIAGESN